MPRSPTVLAALALLCGGCLEPQRGAEVPVPLKPPPTAPAPVRAVVAQAEDAGASPGDAGVTVDPSRLKEARALVPAPVLYGRFTPSVGTWVDYRLQGKQGDVKVRVSLVGETKRADGSTVYQLELDHELSPRTLIVLWMVGGERPFIERLAVSVPPHAPLSIPVDLYSDQPELRGVLTGEKEVELRQGPFAGKARQLGFRRESGDAIVVVSTSKVPLFGVESVRGDEMTWAAVKSGTGATPTLDAVPIAIPRMQGQ